MIPLLMIFEELGSDLCPSIMVVDGTLYGEANADLNEVKKSYDGRLDGSKIRIQAERNCSRAYAIARGAWRQSETALQATAGQTCRTCFDRRNPGHNYTGIICCTTFSLANL